MNGDDRDVSANQGAAWVCTYSVGCRRRSRSRRRSDEDEDGGDGHGVEQSPCRPCKLLAFTFDTDKQKVSWLSTHLRDTFNVDLTEGESFQTSPLVNLLPVESVRPYLCFFLLFFLEETRAQTILLDFLLPPCVSVSARFFFPSNFHQSFTFG